MALLERLPFARSDGVDAAFGDVYLSSVSGASEMSESTSECGRKYDLKASGSSAVDGELRPEPDMVTAREG
jgi:hypothetical protein